VSDMAQLTWRAVLLGSCLGGVLSLTNLYIGLKAGWGHSDIENALIQEAPRKPVRQPRLGPDLPYLPQTARGATV